jgi:hypothetical protein
VAQHGGAKVYQLQVGCCIMRHVFSLFVFQFVRHKASCLLLRTCSLMVAGCGKHAVGSHTPAFLCSLVY